MPDLRWPLAVVAVGVAAVVVWVAIGNQPKAATVRITDSADDVFGPAAPEVAEAADLAAATLVRDGDEYRVDLRLHQPLDRSVLTDATAQYDIRLESAQAAYVVRVQVAAKRTAASSIDSRQRTRPFVLEAPVVREATVSVRIPKDAVDRLPASFTWGITAGAGGSGDRLPSDLSARFPDDAADRPAPASR